jgi:glycosyltransferase involved in cell wall biosynthesis
MPHPYRKTPLVSVIVITYNHGPYIEECLESLANQDCDFPFEILVGEDCSTDDTREHVLKISKRYPDLIRPILSDRNLGAHNNSRNLMSLAAGKHIAICEGDDYWHRSDKLRRQVEILEASSDISLVCTDADAYFQNTGKRIHSIHERNGQWNNLHEDMTLALLTRKINIFTCSVCMPKELRLKILEDNPYEFSNEHLMGDLQLWLELSRLGRIVPIRESLATYRVIAESASRSSNYMKIFKFQQSALQLSEHYVRKFGYEANVLHQVRMTQIWGMIDLVMKHREDALRGHVLNVIQSRSMQPSRLSERVAFWALGTQSRVNRCAPISPLFFKARMIPVKIRAFAGKFLQTGNK